VADDTVAPEYLGEFTVSPLTSLAIWPAERVELVDGLGPEELETTPVLPEVLEGLVPAVMNNVRMVATDAAPVSAPPMDHFFRLLIPGGTGAD
jgi:hypothetical protein